MRNIEAENIIIQRLSNDALGNYAKRFTEQIKTVSSSIENPNVHNFNLSALDIREEWSLVQLINTDTDGSSITLNVIHQQTNIAPGVKVIYKNNEGIVTFSEDGTQEAVEIADLMIKKYCNAIMAENSTQ